MYKRAFFDIEVYGKLKVSLFSQVLQVGFLQIVSYLFWTTAGTQSGGFQTFRLDFGKKIF